MPLHVMVTIFVLHFCGAERITDPLIEVGGITNYCYPGENPQCVEGAGGGKNTIASECPSDAGKMQSGVDIPYAPEDKFKFIKLAATEAYAESRSFAIGNNGHTVQLRMHKGDDFLIGGPLVKNIAYTLDSIHFHWSSSSKGDVGNEHHIFGKSNFPLEIHLVHYKKKFGNLREAIKSKEADALVVIAVPYTVDTNGNEYLVPVIRYLKDVTKFKQTTNGEGLAVRDLFIPKILEYKNFFMARYQGSLTTPTCDQVVRWLVLTETETFPIGRDQLDEFRTLKDDDGHPLADNIRPIQPLNGRVVEYFIVITSIKDENIEDFRSNGFSITHLPSRELLAIISSMLSFLASLSQCK